MAEVVMPRLSDSMEEGTILAWMKQVGDEVAVGDELVEIETDKANMAYEADVAGVLSEILAAEGDVVAIGAPIARIGGDEAPDASGGVSAAEEPKAAEAVAMPAGPTVESTPPPDPQNHRRTDVGPAGMATAKAKASPLAKRIARERGVDLARLTGSGPGGRIVKADVERVEAPAPGAAAGAAETAKGRTTYRDLSKLQEVIGRRMAESKATAPHFYLQSEIDMSAAVGARARLKTLTPEGEAVPSFNDMIVKACAIALRENPLANGAYKDGRFELYSRVNVGVAVAAEDALVVPTVFDADRKGLREIAADARALAAKVRDGSITPPELSGGTFTVSNLGMYGVSNFSAVVNSPQAAILAVGAIAEKPVVREGEIATAHLLGVTLSCDHRVLYGAPAAEFLARIRALLEEPLSLAL